jgi:hypothetical protein
MGQPRREAGAKEGLISSDSVCYGLFHGGKIRPPGEPWQAAYGRSIQTYVYAIHRFMRRALFDSGLYDRAKLVGPAKVAARVLL